ncbi:DUF1007 family protein [Pelagibius litoralis]|uniref:DUF1007 family protein n=1 Tax=Pelagibius litoralis TaxID=374515 RepID=A0A967F2H4_9PROT|nr:DUF1007 family protein [Pelagibius litoralis]NIA71792.1 DUF1007 family protein [Pelagibius litoralis]
MTQRSARWKRVLGAALAVFVMLSLTANRSVAHPHVWIDSVVRLIFDDNHHVTALEVEWHFDEFYSLFAVEDLDKNADGKLDEAELRPLAELNVTSLESYRYFTYVKVDGVDAAYEKVRDYSSRFDDGILSLRFVLPLSVPVDPRTAQFSFSSYDPSFYISIEPGRETPVILSDGAPEGCALRLTRGADTETLNLADTDIFDAGGQSIAARFASRATLSCASPAVIQ